MVQDGLLKHYIAHVRIEQHFHPSPADPPYNLVTENRLFSDHGAVEWEELDFLTVRRIQNFTHDEDYNLGLSLTPSVAWAPKINAIGTKQEQIIPRLDVHKGFTWANQLLLMKSSYSSKYINGHNGNRDLLFPLSAPRVGG